MTKTVNHRLLRKFFSFFNKTFMVPMFLLGFGALIGNWITGYIMVLRTIGRKSGKTRYSPVNYALFKGNVYCIAGFGQISDWYRNILVSSEVEAILPGGAIYGRIDLTDSMPERVVVLRLILKNAGFAGYFEGFDPKKIGDEELLERTKSLPLVKIIPMGIASGAFDPGGAGRVWSGIFTLALIILILVCWLA